MFIANARSLAIALEKTDLTYINAASNAGYGASVSLGAAVEGHWDWLFVCNDDIAVDSKRLREEIARCLAVGDAGLVYFDEELDRPIPGIVGTWLSVSLVGTGVARLLRQRSRSLSTSSAKRGLYRSFSAVAISRELWNEIGPLDESMRFTYEDADFVRRAMERGARITSAVNAGILHEHSSTGSRHISSVLPVSSWAAMRYLSKWETGEVLAKWVIVTALIARIPMVVIAGGRRMSHLRGVFRSLRAVFLNREPGLPKYEDL